MGLTRDVRVRNNDSHAHYELEQKLRNISALLLGQGSRIEILVPRYNRKEYGGGDAIVEARYAEFLRGLGHSDKMAWSKDCRERGVISLRIVPGGGQISQKLADTIFDGLGS
jgi:hypothetical protein